MSPPIVPRSKCLATDHQSEEFGEKSEPIWENALEIGDANKITTNSELLARFGQTPISVNIRDRAFVSSKTL